ncbi:DUF6471 domain-containing protein [Janthinobacterium sp. Mn2066]|uniref:DUF6471 domain-containing protein n=1 Tax=Janthinobacterium sp. Mn2066 TaxID=3395264 RepID=UPI003BD092DA
MSILKPFKCINKTMPDILDEASNILKAELRRRAITYKNLAKLLESQGLKENETQLRTKINRGAFSFHFLIHVLRAIGADKVDISNKQRYEK